MSATGNGGTEAVVVPIKVEVDNSSLDAMRAKLKGAQADVDALKTKATAPTYLDFQVSEAKANVKALTVEVKALEKANRDAAKEAEKAASKQAKLGVEAFKWQQKAAGDADKAAAGKVKDLFGTSVFELGARSLAGAFGKGKEETKAIEGALMAGGEALAGGAAFAAKAALTIATAAVAVTAAGIKYGIEGTADRIKNQAVLDKLTRGQGEEADDFNKAISAETGVSEDKSLERMKGLIQAKFGKEDTGAILRASADIGEVKGEAKAELFLKTLEKIQFEGAATEKSIKALEGAGVDKGDLLAGLARAGETTEQVTARLKAGKVASDEFARAAAAVVQKDIGGVAGKGLDAMVNRLKIGFDDLFDDFDIGPVEELGNTLEKALSGKDGAELKKALSAAGTEVLALAKNVTAADIKSLFGAAATAASFLAENIKTAAGAAGELWNFAKRVSGSGSHTEAGSSGDAEGDAIEQEINAGNRRAAIKEMEIERQKAAAEKAKAAAAASGAAVADGVAAGIEANASKPAAAADAMMKGTIAAADAAAKIKSPSRVMWDRGNYIDEGAAGGIDDNAGKPAAAASRMMGRVVRAGADGGTVAASGGGGASVGPGGGGGGGNVYHFSPVVNVQGGGADVAQQVDRALLAGYAGWLAMQRQSQRDAQENRLPMVPQ